MLFSLRAPVAHGMSSLQHAKANLRRTPSQRLITRLSDDGCIKRRWQNTKAKGEFPSADLSTQETGFLATSLTALSVGTLAGALGSLAGMGGGFVMIPLMTSRLLPLRLTQHQAHGTSLAAVGFTGLAGALGYADQVQYDSALAIALGGIITARLGAQTAARLSGPALKKALGVLMLLMAPLVPAKAYVMQFIESIKNEPEKTEQRDVKNDESNAADDDNDGTNDKEWSLGRYMIPTAIGLCSGFLAGVFGVGGGTIVVPALVVGTDLTHHQALATSLAAMTLPAAAGVYAHAQAGNVALRVAPGLALGACVGAYVGGRYVALKTDEGTLRWGFSALLTALGLRTLLRA